MTVRMELPKNVAKALLKTVDEALMGYDHTTGTVEGYTEGEVETLKRISKSLERISKGGNDTTRGKRHKTSKSRKLQMYRELGYIERG